MKERTLIRDLNRLSDRSVELAGFVVGKRSHSQVLFLDLKDRTGKAQIVFTKESQDFELARSLSEQSVVSLKGRVKARPKGSENKAIVSGQVEVEGESLEVLSSAATLPLPAESDNVNEDRRLKYRYLDLRRERLQSNLKLRALFIQALRQAMIREEFLEIETPILSKSTPEGARDFLVPSRLRPGSFYALPQSPQQYKQLLQVAGFERYFQIARCFRDEDTRGDRQPEISQCDIEMSFVDEEEILALTESLITEAIKVVFPEKKIQTQPWPRMTYRRAIEDYQSDRPDIRDDNSDKDRLAFLWVTDFPMFSLAADGHPTAAHHPFTKPKFEKGKKLVGDETAYQYDLVLNGFEVAGGSLRTTDPEILTQVFNHLGHNIDEIKSNFGHLFEAFGFGVPPHGGIAIGLDRILMAILGEMSIREVIAFPKTGDGRDIMMAAPSRVKDEQLKELGLRIAKER